MSFNKIPDKISVELGIPLDDDGYLDRTCPNEVCQSEFKILAEDWKEKVRDEEVFCPVCGFTSPSTEWLTQAQAEYLKSAALAQFKPLLDSAMQDIARDFNRKSSKGGFIRMTLSYKSLPPEIVILPNVLELMQQRYCCEVCGCHYAAIGSAFFCPACGHNSVQSTIAETLKTIRKLSDIKEILKKNLDKDATENTYRLMCEDYMNKLVTLFQRFAEVLFKNLPNSGEHNPRRNLFQNLSESSDLWEQALGIRYESMLTPNEWKEMHRYFQQRHILVHKDGLVDGDYVAKTSDPNYQSGQRLVIKEHDVLRFTDLVENLTSSLKSACQNKIENKGIENGSD